MRVRYSREQASERGGLGLAGGAVTGFREGIGRVSCPHHLSTEAPRASKKSGRPRRRSEVQKGRLAVPPLLPGRDPQTDRGAAIVAVGLRR